MLRYGCLVRRGEQYRVQKYRGTFLVPVPVNFNLLQYFSISKSNYLLDLLVACGPVCRPIALNKQVRYCLKVAPSILVTLQRFGTSL